MSHIQSAIVFQIVDALFRTSLLQLGYSGFKYTANFEQYQFETQATSYTHSAVLGLFVMLHYL